MIITSLRRSRGCHATQHANTRAVVKGDSLSHKETLIIQGNPLLYQEIPYHTRKSLIIQGNPLSYKEIPYHTRKSLIIQANPLLYKQIPAYVMTLYDYMRM